MASPGSISASSNPRADYPAARWIGLAGFGAGATALLAVGLVLDWGARAGAGQWGLGFMTLGLGGMVAVLCALALRQRA